MIRNLKMYEDINPNAEKLQHMILNFTKECGLRINGTMRNRVYDLNIVTSFGIRGIKTKISTVKEGFFRLPNINQTLIYCDEAAKGNPGVSCFGSVGRNKDGVCLCTVSGGLGIATNYIVKVMALIAAGEWDVRLRLMDVLFSLDSTTVILSFTKGKNPWIVLNRWKRVTSLLRSITFRHSYREVNFSADKLVKRGL